MEDKEQTGTDVTDTNTESNPGRTKLHPAVLLFLVFPLMGIIAALAVGGPRNQSASALLPPIAGYTPDRQIVNNPAPDFELKTVAGQPVKLSSLQGQWVFLNFWATWCPPCKQEMPTFQGLLDGKFNTALKFTVLAVDNAESAEVVQSYLDGLKLKIPVVLDTDRTAARVYGVVQLPMTFIIDPAGVVRVEHLGEMTPDYLTEYLKRMASGKLS